MLPEHRALIEELVSICHFVLDRLAEIDDYDAEPDAMETDALVDALTDEFDEQMGF